MEDLDVECSVLMDENTTLENKVKVLEARLSEAIMIQYQLERERGLSNSPDLLGGKRSVGNGPECPDIHEEIHRPQVRLLGEIEHDDPQIKSEAKAVKLESGGSLYSSTESINQVPLCGPLYFGNYLFHFELA